MRMHGKILGNWAPLLANCWGMQRNYDYKHGRMYYATAG